MSRGQGRVYQRGTVWWLDYGLGGRRHREPTDAASKREAHDILRERIGDRKTGKLVARPERVLLAEYATSEDGEEKLVGGLRWLHEMQYDLDGLRSKDRVRQCWDRIEEFFPAPTPVTAVTPQRLDEYATARLAAGAARQTVNNELSALRRGFNLSIAKGLLTVAPKVKLPRVQNEREGFFEDADFGPVLLELPAWATPVLKFLRYTGWRVNEALGLTWDKIDRDAGVIRLYGRQTKGKAARVFPFASAPDLKELLEALWTRRNGSLYVFHYEDGRPVNYQTLRAQFKRACKRTGTDRIIHDLRRTAVRELIRAGVDPHVAMRLCGMKTDSILKRYLIINEDDLAHAVAKRFSPTGTVTAQSTLPQEPVSR